MTRKEHIKLAQQAFIDKGFWPNEIMWECWKDAWLAGVAAERERCEKVCDEMDEAFLAIYGTDYTDFQNDPRYLQMAGAAIRKGE